MSAEPQTPAVDACPPAGEAAAVRLPWGPIWVALLAVSAAAATAVLVSGGGAAGAPGLFIPILCLCILILAAAIDAATARIPNPLTYAAIVAGLALNALGPLADALVPQFAEHWLGGVSPVQSVCGVLVLGGIGLVGVLLAGMGGGDMKLLAAVGALLGFSHAASVMTCAMAAAVVYALVNLLIAGRLSAVLRAASVSLLNAAFLRKLEVPEEVSRRTIPLAVPILAGLILAQVPPIAAGLAWLRGG